MWCDLRRYLNLFYMSFNPGIYNFNPEIPELDNNPGIAIPTPEPVSLPAVGTNLPFCIHVLLNTDQSIM